MGFFLRSEFDLGDAGQRETRFLLRHHVVLYVHRFIYCCCSVIFQKKKKQVGCCNDDFSYRQVCRRSKTVDVGHVPPSEANEGWRLARATQSLFCVMQPQIAQLVTCGEVQNCRKGSLTTRAAADGGGSSPCRRCQRFCVLSHQRVLHSSHSKNFSNNVAVGMLVCHFSFSGVKARRHRGCATTDLFFTTDATVGGGGEEVTDFYKESRHCLREEVRFVSGRACSHVKSTAERKEVRQCSRFH